MSCGWVFINYLPTLVNTLLVQSVRSQVRVFQQKNFWYINTKLIKGANNLRFLSSSRGHSLLNQWNTHLGKSIVPFPLLMASMPKIISFGKGQVGPTGANFWPPWFFWLVQAVQAEGTKETDFLRASSSNVTSYTRVKTVMGLPSGVLAFRCLLGVKQSHHQSL